MIRSLTSRCQNKIIEKVMNCCTSDHEGQSYTWVLAFCCKKDLKSIIAFLYEKIYRVSRILKISYHFPERSYFIYFKSSTFLNMERIVQAHALCTINMQTYCVEITVKLTTHTLLIYNMALYKQISKVLSYDKKF